MSNTYSSSSSKTRVHSQKSTMGIDYTTSPLKRDTAFHDWLNVSPENLHDPAAQQSSQINCAASSHYQHIQQRQQYIHFNQPRSALPNGAGHLSYLTHPRDTPPQMPAMPHSYNPYTPASSLFATHTPKPLEWLNTTSQLDSQLSSQPQQKMLHPMSVSPYVPESSPLYPESLHTPRTIYDVISPVEHAQDMPVHVIPTRPSSDFYSADMLGRPLGDDIPFMERLREAYHPSLPVSSTRSTLDSSEIPEVPQRTYYSDMLATRFHVRQQNFSTQTPVYHSPLTPMTPATPIVHPPPQKLPPGKRRRSSSPDSPLDAKSKQDKRAKIVEEVPDQVSQRDEEILEQVEEQTEQKVPEPAQVEDKVQHVEEQIVKQVAPKVIKVAETGSKRSKGKTLATKAPRASVERRSITPAPIEPISPSPSPEIPSDTLPPRRGRSSGSAWVPPADFIPVIRKTASAPLPKRTFPKPLSAASSLTSLSSSDSPHARSASITPETEDEAARIYTRRTFPSSGAEKVDINEHFPLFYRQFYASHYFKTSRTQTPSNLLASNPPGSSAWHYNPPRDNYPFDLYTPRFVRGVGTSKVGLCPVCVEPPERGGEGRCIWLGTKVSAFNYHMQYFHGLSAQSHLPLSPPLRYRVVPLVVGAIKSKTKTGKIRETNKSRMKSEILEGLCHCCNKWIQVEGIKDVEVKVKELFWWKHAALCHGTSTIKHERDVFVIDNVHRHLEIVHEEDSLSDVDMESSDAEEVGSDADAEGSIVSSRKSTPAASTESA